jgi:aminoglycoside phosphotransferase (APT) family kinase protein
MVDIKSVNLENYGKPVGFYSRQLKVLSAISEMQACVVNQETGKYVGSLYKINELTAWFYKNLPQDRASIIHGDFKIDNLVNKSG